MKERTVMRNSIWALTIVAALVLPMAASTKKSTPWDQRSERLVREDLAKKDVYRNVSVSVEDGIATLQGEVDLLIHKFEAERRAKRVDRIAGVRNEIRVVPPEPISDLKLAETVAEKLRYDRIGFGITFNALTVSVKDGFVTVGGKVRDFADRDSALAIVESTRGVTGMLDNIDVAPASNFDDDLRIRLARAIYGHSALQKYALDPQKPIRIVVESGNVEIHGVVNTEAEKQIALIQARSVPGSFNVTDKLLVAGQVIQ